MPPDPARVWEYTAPTVPPGNGDAVVIVGAGAMVSAAASVVFDTTVALSLTCTVKLKVPEVVTGVPLKTPALLRVSPLGKIPSLTVQE